MRPKILDHVALWVADRDPITDFVTERLTMHVIEKTDKFTLVGTNARRGKLTLFDAEGPRERGALKHVALRVNDLDEALRRSRRRARSTARTAAPTSTSTRGCASGSSRRRRTSTTTSTTSRSSPRAREETAQKYKEFGFAPEAETRVEVGGAFVEFHPGEPGDPERPLLNHLAVLVDSADETLEEAKQAGMDVADVVDAANTLAVFVWGPERVKIEYVEQKPTFALK